MPRFSKVVAASALLLSPGAAQFGLGGKRQAGTNFEDLQEMAKKKQGGAATGGAADPMQEMLNAMQKGGGGLEGMEGLLGDQFNAAIEQMMAMDPDELAKQMEQAMEMMTNGDVVENIVNQKDAVIASLEESGAVPPEELAKYKADPNYFELKMRESFESMGDIFSNPETMKQAAEAMQEMSKVMNDPDAMKNMMDMMGGNLDDEQIEEVRLQILSGDMANTLPGFKEAFETAEMQAILKDPVKWRETVKEGFGGMMGAAGAAGAADVTGARQEL